MPRPTCAHCGQSYGRRATSLEHTKYKVGEPKPRYEGNGIVVKETSYNTGKSTGSFGKMEFKNNEIVIHRHIWDGETYWGGYKPFCTLICALDYARKAFSKIGKISQ